MIIWLYSHMAGLGIQKPITPQPPAPVKTVSRLLKSTEKKAKYALIGPATKKMKTVNKMPTWLRTSEFSSVQAKALTEGHEPSTPQIFTASGSFAITSAMDALASKLVTINVSATPIEAVVGIISKQTNANIVLLSKPDQKITISVKDMPLPDVLKHLATLGNLRILEANNAIVMAEEATLKSAYPKEYEATYNPKATEDTSPTPPVVVDNVQRVYTLKFQGGTQVATALKDYLLAKKVTIVALPNTTIPNLGSSANGGLTSAAQTGSTQSSGSNQDIRLKRVLLSGPVDAVAEATNILMQMDVPRKQVEIRVTIHDVSNDALKDAGFTWDFGQTTISEKVSGNVNLGTFSRTGLSFVNTIHALEQANKAKLLASPNVSVMDGELGSILIGEKRRFPTVAGTNANGQFIYSTEEQNVGIYLLVATDVSEDGTVTMAVNAQVSSILGFLQLNGGSYPQISTRESKSTLILKDGQTMVMGGLLRDEEIINLQKVPLLGQIPFFGELFNSRKKQKNSSQLLITITPHVVQSQ